VLSTMEKPNVEIDIRPWGKEERVFPQNTQCTVKILNINEEEHPSVQYHHKRDEFWFIIEGKAKIRLGEETIEATEGDHFSIPKKTIRRYWWNSKNP